MRLELYGIDHTIFTYKEDSNNNFETDDGKHLSGELLLHHLHKSNKTLAEKAFYYQRKFEEAQTRLYQKDASVLKKLITFDAFIGTFCIILIGDQLLWLRRL